MVLGRIQKVVRETLAPDSFHVIFLSPFLSRDLSDGSTPNPKRIFVEKIRAGAPFLSVSSKADAAKLQPVLEDAGTLMAVPVRSDHGIFGVLVMESRKENAFDPRWRDVLSYFAEIISMTQVIHVQRESAGERAKVEELIKTNGELHHRIANSLGIIKQSARELEREQSELGRDWVRYITSHSTRIENVLLELRDLSSPRSVSAGVTDVTRIVRSAVEELALQDPDVPIDVSQAPRILALADPEELGEALVCLIKNAFEAIDERRTREVRETEQNDPGESGRTPYRIRIDLAERDSVVEIVIKDDGIGFSEDTRDRLFLIHYSQPRSAGEGSIKATVFIRRNGS